MHCEDSDTINSDGERLSKRDGDKTSNKRDNETSILLTTAEAASSDPTNEDKLLSVCGTLKDLDVELVRQWCRNSEQKQIQNKGELFICFEVNKNSTFIADFGLTKGYQSSLAGSKRNSIGHFLLSQTCGNVLFCLASAHSNSAEITCKIVGK